MKNRKPPKKAPPISGEPRKTKIDNQDSAPPKETLNNGGRDIGTSDSATESSNAQPSGLKAKSGVPAKVDTAKAVVNAGGEGVKAAHAEGSERAVLNAVSDKADGQLPQTQAKSSWAELVKGSMKQLKKCGEGFTLESGEPCVKIPNSVIDRHKKEWDCFVLGQFYSSPPTHGTIHNIANGIWSRQFRDITVSKMADQAFLFRIPNASTRQRVLTQRLWQFEGRTMFVAKWEPGITQEKPELTSAPIWLELRDVPLPFFNADGLEYIASLVGEPKFLHHSTENKLNLEVAKVFTVIDPRKPLPEAVNAQFDSGEIRRIRVSSPWMPPVCAFCNNVGHSLKHCKEAPARCSVCASTIHEDEACPRKRLGAVKATGTKGGTQPQKLLDHPAKQPLTRAVVSQNSEEIPKQLEKEVPIPSKVKGKGIALSQPATKAISSEPRPKEKLILGGNSVRKAQSHSLPMREKQASSDSAESSSAEESQDSDSSGRYISGLEEGEFKKVLTHRQRKAIRGKGLKHHP